MCVIIYTLKLLWIFKGLTEHMFSYSPPQNTVEASKKKKKDFKIQQIKKTPENRKQEKQLKSLMHSFDGFHEDRM